MQANIQSHKPLYSFILLCLLTIPLGLQGQGIKSTLGRFSVDFDQGCVPFTIVINEDIPFDETFYDFGDSLVSDTEYTYDEPGHYIIYQVIQEDDLPDGKIDSLQITLSPQSLPEFNIFTCADNRVAVEITDDQYDFYRVHLADQDTLQLLPGEQSEFVEFPTNAPNEITVQGFFGSGSPSCLSNTKSFQPLAPIFPATVSELRVLNDTLMTIAFEIFDNAAYTLQKSTSGSPFEDVTRLNPTDDFIDFVVDDIPASPCFRIITNDSCDGSVIESETYCTLHLEVTNSPSGNELSWQANPESTIPVQAFKDDSLLNQGFFEQLFDPSLICEVGNCYRLAQGSSLSRTICLVPGPINNLPAPLDLQSTIDGQDILLSWVLEQPIPIASYSLSENGRISTFSTDLTTTSVAFEDTSSPLNFELSYQDDCGNQSLTSLSTTPVFLNLSQSNGTSSTLAWNRYEGWIEGIKHYFLQRWDGTQWVEEEFIFSGREIEVDPERQEIYRIDALSLESEPRHSYSNSIIIESTPNLYFPNAFTPDGDGLNDIFIPVGANISTYEIMIFNRWGEIIFQSDQLDRGWDGIYQGRKAPPGAYTFKVRFGNEESGKSSQSGTFVLLRN
ncbi:MAG: gliding motility-associated C-terminal domain-containing protein [Cyclobacteriaceae bacterium]